MKVVEKTVEVKKTFDARQAAIFVQTANKFNSRIQLLVDDKKVNAKSIMGVISLAIDEGQIAIIVSEGDDEAKATAEMAEVLR